MKITVSIDTTKAILDRRGLLPGGRVQKYLDSRVLAYCEPYVPMQTGALKQSGITGTVIGSGVVVYNAPYARRIYYGKFNLRRNLHPKACRLWFEQMKADRGDELLKGVMRYAGAR